MDIEPQSKELYKKSSPRRVRTEGLTGAVGRAPYNARTMLVQRISQHTVQAKPETERPCLDS